MIDGMGRNIDYLRISVIDRCNLRCVYCMPEEGVDTVAQEEILSYEEILALVKLFAKLGIRKIKLTGGEPLVRKNIAYLVKKLKDIEGIQAVTITTNGILLSETMKELADAGIDGINLSLDTLDAQVFEKITGRDRFERVWEGFCAALEYGSQIPLKINCVPMGIEGQKVLELARLAKEYPVHVRFIEMMPIGLGKQFEFYSEQELLEELQGLYGPAKVYEGSLGNGPSRYYTFEGFQGKIGFISAISHKFCGECNRVRLTSQGYLKTCLQYDFGVDLKRLLREDADQEKISEAIREAFLKKPAGHQFGAEPGDHGELHMMAQIGG